MIRATSPRYAASYPLPVRQASALPSASSRFAVARDTLAVQLTLPLVGRVEDFHLQVSAPCRAHRQKRLPLGSLSTFDPVTTTRTHTAKAENPDCCHARTDNGTPCAQPQR